MIVLIIIITRRKSEKNLIHLIFQNANTDFANFSVTLVENKKDLQCETKETKNIVYTVSRMNQNLWILVEVLGSGLKSGFIEQDLGITGLKPGFLSEGYYANRERLG